MSFGERTRQWNGGDNDHRRFTADDDDTGTLVIGAVFPAEVSLPAEVYTPDPADGEGNPLTMNPVIRGQRGPPLRIDTTQWPLT